MSTLLDENVDNVTITKNGFGQTVCIGIQPQSSIQAGISTVIQINDPAPVLYTSMRTLSTNSTSETNLAQVTLTVQNSGQLGSPTVTTIRGHATGGGTATFWVRRGSLTGPTVCSGTTTNTTETTIASALTYEAVNTVYWWDASNSVGGSDTAVIDGAGGSGTKSFTLQGRWILFAYATGLLSDGQTFNLPANRLTKLNAVQADMTSGLNIITDQSAQATASPGENGSSFNFAAGGERVALIASAGPGSSGSATAFSAVGNIVSV